MKKLIIFDLDGTLLNTGLDIQSTLNKTLQHFSLPTLTLEKTLEYVGDGAKHLVERAIGNSLRFNEIYEFYRTAFAKTDNELTTLYEGEDRALKNFMNAGIKLCILTNKPQDATDNVVKKFLNAYDFYKVIGYGDFPLKPDSTACEFIMNECGIEKSDALFVGDGETDVLTARNAGIDCVSALWGYRTKSQLEQFGATLFAENFATLEKIVSKI